MKIVTVNGRGWHWALTDVNHQCLMRKEKSDILLLSDVHTSDAGRFNSSYATVVLEEFVMIVGKTLAIVLAPTTQNAWRDTGYERWKCRDTGRMIAVGLTISGIKWRVVSVCAPDRTKPACLKDLFLENALVRRDETLATSGRNEVQVWVRDWNAHIGKDAEGARGIGTLLLPCSTKEMGRKLLRWIGEAAHDMVLIDTFRPASRRGTFMNLNGIQKHRNELDVALVSGIAASMFNSVRTISTVWVTTVQKFMASIWQRFTRKQKVKQIAVARMRGKSEEVMR